MKTNLDQPSSFPETLSQAKTGRLFSLDLLKAMSIVAVVAFHSTIVPKSSYEGIAQIDLYVSLFTAPLRFCVPVFLTISFLLFERDLAKHTDSIGSAIKKRMVRLLMPTMFWFGLTSLLKFVNGGSWIEIFTNMLNGEIFTGAYYLLVLLQFVPVFIFLRSYFSQPQNVLITILLQLFIYFSIYVIAINPNYDQIMTLLRNINRPLFVYWFVYMALGTYIWRNWASFIKISTRIPLKVKASLFIAYLIIQLVEQYWSFLIFQGKVPPFEYVMFSCILSVFVMILCFASIQDYQVPLWVRNLVSSLSKYSLGIFCVNGTLYQIIGSVSNRFLSEATFSLPEFVIVKIISWVILLVISLMLSILLDRIGLKAVVR